MGFTSQQFLIYDGSTLANFKAWAQAISNAFSSSSWAQTSDTGQVNWSTIASVPTAGTWVYEIWKPTDALQTGASQYFVKMEYGINTSNGPRPRMTLCSGTDGAGNATGFIIGPYDWFGTGGGAGLGSSVTGDSYFSGDVDRFGMMLWRSLSNGFTGGTGDAAHIVAIERTKDVNGNNTADGVHLMTLPRSNQTRGIMTLVFGLGTYAAGHGDPDNSGCYPTCGWEWQNASSLFNNGIAIYHVIPTYGIIGYPVTEIAFAHIQDVGEACTFQTTIYGNVHTYITTGLISLSFPAQNTAECCMRYD